MAAFAVLIGLTSGGMIALIAPIIAQISPQTAIPRRVGLFFSILGIPYVHPSFSFSFVILLIIYSCRLLVGTPISGALLQNNHGDYDKLIIFTGVMFLGGLVFLIPARLYLNRKLFARL